MDDNSVSAPQAITGEGYPYLVGVLAEIASDEQLEHAFNVCRDNIYKGDHIGDALRILERRALSRFGVCPECQGSGRALR